MFKVYEIGKDWNIDKGTLISQHKTEKAAIERLKKEAKKRAKEVYYYNVTHVNKNLDIYDYGLYTKFLAIAKDDEDENWVCGNETKFALLDDVEREKVIPYIEIKPPKKKAGIIGYLIKNKDKLYYNNAYRSFGSLTCASLYSASSMAEYEILADGLKDCKSVKVRIEEVE